MKLFDVAIVGASISGASLAACLGWEGLAVALIDKEKFPRRKACGEGISNIALESMQRMGFDTRHAVSTGKPFYTYRVDLDSRSFEFASDHRRLLRGVGIERYVLDEMVVNQASKIETVAPFLETKVDGIERASNYFRLSLSDGQQIQARRLVLADGASSPNSTALGIPKFRTSQPLWGISFLLEGTYHRTTGEVLVVLKDGFEINCTPVGNNRLNLCFLAERDLVKPLQDPVLRQTLLHEATEKACFTGTPMGPPLQVGPVGATRRPYAHNDIMLLGDSAETLDPVAGMGMTHGVLMAEIASKHILAIHRGELSVQDGLASYSKAAEETSRLYRGFTKLTASTLRCRARKFLLPTLASTFLPGLIRTSLNASPAETSANLSLPNRFLSLMGSQGTLFSGLPVYSV